MSLTHSNLDLPATIGGEITSCTICTQPLIANDIIASTPCGHTFHQQCIRDYILDFHGCPVCNRECTIQQLSMPNNNLSAELSAADRRTGEANAANGSIASNDANRGRTGGRRGRNIGQRRGAGPRTGMTLRSNRHNPASHHERSLDTDSIIATSRI